MPKATSASPFLIFQAWSRPALISMTRAMAEEALAFHIEGLVADDEAICEPSSLEKVMADRDNRDGVAILVSARSATRKAVRVNVTLPEDVLEQIDAFAESHGFTRSGFLAKAARKAMELELS